MRRSRKVEELIPENRKENIAHQIKKTDSSQPSGSLADRIMFLQTTIGNHAVDNLIKSGTLQAKLRIGQPDDIYEREADRVAEQMMRMPEPCISDKKDFDRENTNIQGKCPKGKQNEEIQQKHQEDAIQPQRDSGNTSEVPPELESNINALNGGGQALPYSIRGFFEPRFGYDFSHVRLHKDESTEAIDALAYTIGDNIVFNKSRYSPDTIDGKRLLAHELAHVTQQRSLQQFKASSGQDELSDSEPDQIAKEENAGEKVLHLAPLETDIIYRKAAPSAVASVGGETSSITFMEGTKGEENVTIAPGEKGFSVQMLKEVPSVAGKTFAYYKEAHLTPIQPNIAKLQEQIRIRARQKVEAEDEAGSFFNTPSTTKTWEDRANDCEKHYNMLTADVTNERNLCQNFNAGVPRANQMFVSLAKLEAMQEMLGVNNPEAMSKAVVDSLKEATSIAEKTQVKGEAGALEVPAADLQVTQAAQDLTLAQKRMSTAWIGVQRTLVLKRAEEVKKEGEADEKRKKEIGENIATWKKIGATIDVSMAVMGVGVTGATEGGGLIGSIEGGGTKGLTETKSAVEKAVGISVPTSAADILDTAAKIYYFSELEKIRKNLATLQNEINANIKVAEELGTAQALKAFQDTLDEFEKRSKDLQKRLIARQQAYLKFGQKLDEAAAKDPKLKGSAPGKGKERFATVMVVTSAVREVLAMAAGAQEGFGMDSKWMRNAILTLAANREMKVRGYYSMAMPDEEVAPLAKGYSQLATYESNVKTINNALGGIEAEAKAMMVALGMGHEEAGAY